jgi:hypothetical protein
MLKGQPAPSKRVQKQEEYHFSSEANKEKINLVFARKMANLIAPDLFSTTTDLASQSPMCRLFLRQLPRKSAGQSV